MDAIKVGSRVEVTMGAQVGRAGVVTRLLSPAGPALVRLDCAGTDTLTWFGQSLLKLLSPAKRAKRAGRKGR